MYSIEKTFKFSAAHRIEELPTDNQCYRIHGHNYTVALILEAEELDENGFVVNVHDLSEMKQYIDEHFDHRLINDVVDFPPSSENLARHFYEYAKERWPQTVACRIRETPTIQAEYRGQ